MKLLIISAFCLTAALRIFCGALLKDKTFLSGDSRPVYVTAVFSVLAGTLGACAGGYICFTVFGSYENTAMFTVFAAAGAMVAGIAAAFSTKKIYKISGIYFPALILCPVGSAVCTAVSFSGDNVKALALCAVLSAAVFSAVPVIWHSVKIKTENIKYGFVLEAVCVSAAAVCALSVL